MSNNTLVLTGKIINIPQYRISPAGVETAYFKLWHESAQMQLDLTNNLKNDVKQKVEFSINISTASKQVIDKLKKYEFNKLIRANNINVEIMGYLALRQYKKDNEITSQFVLHAKEINFI